MPRFVTVLVPLLLCLAASAAVAQSPLPPDPADPMQGLHLGDSIRLHLDEYRDYRCDPSDAFPGLTFCHKIRFERNRYGSYNVMYSFLHTRDGTLVYVDRYQRPAMLDAAAAARVIDVISRARGEPTRTSTMPQRPGLPDGILAVWGNTTLEPLDNARVVMIDKGIDTSGKKTDRKNDKQSGKPADKAQAEATELLVDYLGDVSRSARERLPIYRLSGGAGFVWVAGLDPRGNGFLRATAVDASAFAKSR
jgi:hypothetical protein